MVSVSTHATAARIAARRAVNPSRCSLCCSTVRHRTPDGLGGAVAADSTAVRASVGRASRWPQAGARPVRARCPAGRPVCVDSTLAAYLPPQRFRCLLGPTNRGRPSRRRSGRRRRGPLRCAATGCAWPPARCGQVPGLDLAAADGDREVGDGGVLGLAADGGSSSCGSRCCGPAPPRPRSRSGCRSG